MGTAQNGLLEARANYRLRNDVVNAVMMANPILKAVHSSIEASPIERYVCARGQWPDLPLTHHLVIFFPTSSAETRPPSPSRDMLHSQPSYATT